MRASSLLIALSFTYVASSIAAEAVVGKGSSNPTTAGVGATFVTVPYTVGGQTLFSSNIININLASVNNQAYLSGNNAGSAPQGGVGSRQGGLGSGRLIGGTTRLSAGPDLSSLSSTSNSTGLSNSTSSNFPSTSTFSNTVNNGLPSGNGSQGGLSSAGSSSLNLNGGLSSSGQSSLNVTNGTSSAGSSTFNNGSSSLNNTSGSSSVGFNSLNNTVGSSSSGNNSLNNGANSLNTPGLTKPVLLITSLVDSTNPVYGSAGAFFQGVQGTTINTITFQYGSLPTATNQISATADQTPYLVVEDQLPGTANAARFLAVSQGTITRPANGVGLTTVSFNTNQLQLRGSVQRVGIAFFRRGSVVIDNVTINGSPSTGIIAQASDAYPF